MPISSENYINVEGWMVTDYGLSGDELLAFAIIYGFSQDGQSRYRGGRAYIAEWLGCGDKKAGAILTKLTESGYIERSQIKGEKGWKTYQYRTSIRAQNARIDEPNKGETRPSIRAQNAHININGIQKEYKGDESKKCGKDCGKPTYPFPCPDCGHNVFRNTSTNYDECPGCFRTFPH